MAYLPPDDRRRLFAALAMLESIHDAEKLAVVAAAGRILAARGLRWCQLDRALTPAPPTPITSAASDHPTVAAMLAELAAAPLPAHVAAFINGITRAWRRSGRLSPKQVEALRRTWRRNCRQAA